MRQMALRRPVSVSSISRGRSWPAKANTRSVSGPKPALCIWVRLRVNPSEKVIVSCSGVYRVQIRSICKTQTFMGLGKMPVYCSGYMLYIKLRARTRISKQADLRRVIWSAMVRVVKPGRRLANSTILMMHLVASSLNLSQRPRSNRTRWSELEFCRKQTQSMR